MQYKHTHTQTHTHTHTHTQMVEESDSSISVRTGTVSFDALAKKKILQSICPSTFILQSHCTLTCETIFFFVRTGRHGECVWFGWGGAQEPRRFVVQNDGQQVCAVS